MTVKQRDVWAAADWHLQQLHEQFLSKHLSTRNRFLRAWIDNVSHGQASAGHFRLVRDRGRPDGLRYVWSRSGRTVFPSRAYVFRPGVGVKTALRSGAEELLKALATPHLGGGR